MGTRIIHRCSRTDLLCRFETTKNKLCVRASAWARTSIFNSYSIAYPLPQFHTSTAPDSQTKSQAIIPWSKDNQIQTPMDSEITSMSGLASQMCNQIASIFSKPNYPHPPPLDLMVTELSTVAKHNGRVFLYGVGREGLMLKALCMRLAHLGISTHFVFDMTTPPITSTDLLIASAGPGGFSTVDAICSVARSHGARVLVLTAQPQTGSCVKHASVVCYVPAQTMADDEGTPGEKKSRPLMPMGSLYEGAMFVLFEMVVYQLGEALGQSPEAVRSRHTNLE
ncbi:hypothetical protein HS088_TW19G00750 [Tripterygium wilfordii]|uniref:SIS domain-containing protein n=1 Tax=Tripterygium wilfordii TaxID=458696 RepID=A0A7J7CB44_TRIWF|nr:3-hexulose-6-phosphate isomerase [Tripterygium wilfordii]XP_038686115.1 3-hexulose-6-phosphate isomerase [Tripterygium wilfordii]XP_038686116.1 3-hexulose-6-phosphate isomerase [Tripterygium wilfordii]XP_038686117.1 3-hexulose-6-phosphate isomerase [Tripterygium wilfordii]KAF5731145.1 hypothetical protein HS088_TW19G00750 [Tripterygium wilfordii]